MRRCDFWSLTLLLAAIATTGACGRKTTPPNNTPSAEDAGVTADAGNNDAGTSQTPDAGPPPELKLLRVLPPRGPTTGRVHVVITGTGFMRGVGETGSEAKKFTSLKFGQNPSLDLQIIDDETIDAEVPQGRAGLVNVTIENTSGRSVCTGCFTYFEELFVSTLTPREGPLRGGNELVFTGQGFTRETQVLIGGRTSPRVNAVSSTELRALAPEGSTPDSVDVQVFDKNGLATLKRGYRYFENLRVDAATPRFGPLAGGTVLTVNGQGFQGATQVLFGNQAGTALTVTSDTQLTVTTPAVAAPGSVDVTLITPRDRRTVRGGFTYVGAPSAEPVLHAVVPHVGVAAGGNTIALVGTGLDAAGATVVIGGQNAAIQTRTANQLVVTVPAAVGNARVVDVAVTHNANTSTRTGGYTYQVELTALTPGEGPIGGGTAVTLTGSRLPSDLRLTLCGHEVASLGPLTDTTAAFNTPRGSGGAACALKAESVSDPENEATLLNAFRYVETLTLGRAQPDRGALAGGTMVTVFGTGFGEGTVVSFGEAKAKDVKVIDSHTLTCRTPRGSAGSVTVAVSRAGAKDDLPAGFSYYDPRNSAGGLSGGPLVGTLNLTVLDATQGFEGSPVPLAEVMLGTDPSTPFQGITDARGQLTFSDPTLVRAQMLTVWKDGFQSVTVTEINSENLTVYVSRTGGDGEPGTPPPGPPLSQISGKIYGFKAPRPLAPNEVLEARVFLAQVSLFGGAPFSSPGGRLDKWEIAQDGGSYTLFTRAGLKAAYAVLGVKDTGTGTFTPYLMGVRRGITTAPENPAVDQHIVLDMHLDLTVPVTIDGPLTMQGAPATNALYAWLDLGSEGFIPNPFNWGTGTSFRSSVQTTGATVAFPGFPRLDGTNFVFLNNASGPDGSSYFFRRQPGSLAAGIRVGPMLPSPKITAPTTLGGFTGGRIAWTAPPGGVPDIHHLEIVMPSFFGNVTLWSIVLPGTATEVSVPPQAFEKMMIEYRGAELYVFLSSSRSPKFDYAHWSYNNLSAISWSAFTSSMSEVFFP